MRARGADGQADQREAVARLPRSAARMQVSKVCQNLCHGCPRESQSGQHETAPESDRVPQSNWSDPDAELKIQFGKQLLDGELVMRCNRFQYTAKQGARLQRPVIGNG